MQIKCLQKIILTSRYHILANKFKIPELRAKVDVAIKETLAIIARDTVLHFQKSFANEGFTDETFMPWQKRKNSSRRGRRVAGGVRSVKKFRKILTLSGKLRRSIKITEFSSSTQTITSNMPYSKIHNEGGVIEKEFNRKIMSFTSGGRFAKTKTRANRKDVAYQQQVTIGEHSIKMPKRQFMGNSKSLERRSQAKFVAKINTAILNNK